MLIVCPSCASEYDIDGTRLGAKGRKVRCSSCRTEWLAGAVPVVAPTMRPAPPILEGRAVTVRRAGSALQDRGPRSRTPRTASRSRPAERASVAALAAALLLVPAIWFGRSTVVEIFPRSASLFGLLGSEVNVVGLRLRGVASSVSTEDGKRVLVVEGEIARTGAGRATVPPIDVTVEGEAGEELYRWSTKPPSPTLEGGETARFRVRLASPPPEGRRVLVTFAGTRPETEVASR